MKIGYIRTLNRGWVGFHTDCVSNVEGSNKLTELVNNSPSMPDGKKPVCSAKELSRWSINENPNCAICGVSLIEEKEV